MQIKNINRIIIRVSATKGFAGLPKLFIALPKNSLKSSSSKFRKTILFENSSAQYNMKCIIVYEAYTY